MILHYIFYVWWVCMYICLYMYALYVPSMFAYIYIFILCILYILYIYLLSKGMPIGPLKYAFLRGNLWRGLKACRIRTSWLSLYNFTNHWLMEVQVFNISLKSWQEKRHALPFSEQAPKSTKKDRGFAVKRCCIVWAPLQATRQRNDRQWQSSLTKRVMVSIVNCEHCTRFHDHSCCWLIAAIHTRVHVLGHK